MLWLFVFGGDDDYVLMVLVVMGVIGVIGVGGLVREVGLV